jgi:murein DD-endopeptidase MepM/ murein hydrolase activator NlpD
MNSNLRLARRGAFVVAALCLATSPVAEADTASDLAAAREVVTTAQAAANGAAAELDRVETRLEELETHIADLEARIAASKVRAEGLAEIARERAVNAYVHNSSTKTLVIAAGNLNRALRRTELLDRANAADNDAIRQLAALREDMARQKEEVRTQRDEQRLIKVDVEAKAQALQAQLARAQQARDALAARLERERSEAAAAEAARLRAARAVAAGTGNSSPGQIIVNPGGGAFQCPVVGSAYSNSYGPRGGSFHYGIDMLAPTGVPLVAVKAGSVSFVPNEGAGGNAVYLMANDGNVYYYAHLSEYVGGSRSVAQGEIIGRVGSTGRSTAPHLHFEIRLGGANGARINPYDTLRASGC